MYKKKTKYSDMTIEEREERRLERQRRYHKEWMERQTEEKKEEIREKTNTITRGRCEICEKEYGNIYQHKQTKKHQKKMEEKK